MGLFVQPSKPAEECTAEDFVDAAIDNLKLWKETGADQSSDYLISAFAMSFLANAMRKLRPIDDENNC